MDHGLAAGYGAGGGGVIKPGLREYRFLSRRKESPTPRQTEHDWQWAEPLELRGSPRRVVILSISLTNPSRSRTPKSSQLNGLALGR